MGKLVKRIVAPVIEKRWIIRIAIVPFGLLAGVVIIELLLKFSNIWIGRHSDTMFALIQYDSILGWRMKPLLHTTVDLVDVEDIPLDSNSLGFWDREFNRAKRPGIFRIAFLGDSFTWGMGVRKEQRFTHLVTLGNSNWESLNFGIPGYGADQSLLVWTHIARQYSPDFVVFTLYENDYLDILYKIRYGRNKPYFIIQDGTLQLENSPPSQEVFWDNGIYNQIAPHYRHLVKQETEKRSRIVHWLGKNSDFVRFFYTLLRSYSVNSYRENNSTIDKKELSELGKTQLYLMTYILNEMKAQVTATGAKFVIIFAGDSTQEIEAQKTICHKEGIDFLDCTTPSLGRYIDRRYIYYPYSHHWTSAAHETVSSLLKEVLKAQRQ